jgi:DNA-binding MarR family transcriptional regulator
MIAAMPSCNQQTLAERLGVLPSRMVALIDELAEKGLIERRRSQADRRHSELVLTNAGNAIMEKLGRLAAEHEASLCAALTAEDREVLAGLCRRIATEQGLTPDVHPGYRKL